MFQPDKQRDAQFEREKGVRLKKISFGPTKTSNLKNKTVVLKQARICSNDPNLQIQ